MRLAASANGALEPVSSAAGITPITAVVPSTYTTAANTVPRIVARGIVRSGSTTSSAGMVADSNPRKAHSVKVAAAVMAGNVPLPLVLNGRKLSGLMYRRPRVPMATRGASLRIVVTTCTEPAVRTPRTLTQVSSQIAPMPTADASIRSVARAGQNHDR